MPGWELVGDEEQREVDSIFTQSNGVIYRYYDDDYRNGIYRVKRFEDRIKSKLHVNYAHGVCNGTSALVCALRAMGVGKGDEVITQSHTFIATVEAIVEVGAKPVIANIDETLNMNPNHLEELITDNTACIIPVHMAGVSCDMDKIVKIADDNNIFLLEDNAQSFGGTYKGEYLGSIGDAGILSFDSGKMITTGEGGMVLTDDEEIYEHARAVSNHGHLMREDVPPNEDDILCAGFNYRMSEFQGAMGLAQIDKLNNLLERHRENKERLISSISKFNVGLRRIPDKEGDICDSVSFFLRTKKKVDEFCKKWEYGIKNVPNSLRWHFASNWKHLGVDTTNIDSKLINRTVCIPVNYSVAHLEVMAKSLEEIFDEWGL